MKPATELSKLLRGNSDKDRVRGTVLINKVPEISEDLDLVALREQGAIFTVAQLFSDSREYLGSIHSKPQAEVYLKRISAGIEELIANWTKNELQNAEADRELDVEAINVLSTGWHQQKLPENAMQLVDASVKTAIETHAKLWLQNKLDDAIKDEINEKVSEELRSKLWASVKTYKPLDEIMLECFLSDFQFRSKHSLHISRNTKRIYRYQYSR